MKDRCGRLGIPQTDFRFTRRDVREALGWGDTQLKVHLGRLVELEYLVAHRGKQGRAYAYELLYAGEDADGRERILGLIDGAGLQVVPSGGADVSFTENGRGMVGGRSAPGRGHGIASDSFMDAALGLLDDDQALKGMSGALPNSAPSYPHGQPTRPVEGA